MSVVHQEEKTLEYAEVKKPKLNLMSLNFYLEKQLGRDSASDSFILF